uniref:Uncharacterized protein n=1 Tax=Helicotheca tamesis TaxID=374047 RepID=A0A7S2GV14_9STRA|mmetsp:Transcript_11900/g.16440  ORF Transcript_11900/g.16440 Transcript_11900/m.16440 type:complete len:223 (+) Transcript_11900:48-716(+)
MTRCHRNQKTKQVNTNMKSTLALALATVAASDPSVDTGAYPVATGCQGRDPGDTWKCHCKTGKKHMIDNTTVFNQCRLGKRNGAMHGQAEVKLNDDAMGMAVYSGDSTDICGGRMKHCKCTCFDKEALDGVASPRFRTSISTKIKQDVIDPGYKTDCLGLCGANCKGGINGKRYASILIHDVCQSYIRSRAAMPNFNDCSDEGRHAWAAAILSLLFNGSCPA